MRKIEEGEKIIPVNEIKGVLVVEKSEVVKPEVETQPVEPADVEKAKSKGSLHGDPVLVIE